MIAEPSNRVVNALSFDIEDWFHMVGIDAVEDPDSWPSFPSIVVEYTHAILDTLDEHDVKATFFMLGWVAEQHPELAGDIARRGHEVGTHSYWHRKVYDLDPPTFREDMARSIEFYGKTLELQLSGKPGEVTLFQAGDIMIALNRPLGHVAGDAIVGAVEVIFQVESVAAGTVNEPSVT